MLQICPDWLKWIQICLLFQFLKIFSSWSKRVLFDRKGSWLVQLSPDQSKQVLIVPNRSWLVQFSSKQLKLVLICLDMSKLHLIVSYLYKCVKVNPRVFLLVLIHLSWSKLVQYSPDWSPLVTVTAHGSWLIKTNLY